jgi:hypothetical protein
MLRHTQYVWQEDCMAQLKTKTTCVSDIVIESSSLYQHGQVL